MNPKEKLIVRLTGLKWRADGKDGIKSSALTEQEAEQLGMLASLHLDTRHTVAPGVQPQNFCLRFPKTDLPRLVAHGIKFPGSDAIEPEEPQAQEE